MPEMQSGRASGGAAAGERASREEGAGEPRQAGLSGEQGGAAASGGADRGALRGPAAPCA